MKKFAIPAVFLLAFAGCGQRESSARIGDVARAGGLHPIACSVPSASTNDILGVRLGMSPKEIRAALRCANPKYSLIDNNNGNINKDVNWSVSILSRTALQPVTAISASMDYPPSVPGDFNSWSPASDDDMWVGFLGLPGHEEAYAVSHQQSFSGQSKSKPAIEAVRRGLLNKYGQPTADVREYGSLELHWIHDPTGAVIRGGSDLDRDCLVYLGSGTGSKNCGLTIYARVEFNHDSGAVSSVSVSLMDESASMAAYESEKKALEVMSRPVGQAPKF